jgi:hypothetical protein
MRFNLRYRTRKQLGFLNSGRQGMEQMLETYSNQRPKEDWGPLAGRRDKTLAGALYLRAPAAALKRELRGLAERAVHA